MQFDGIEARAELESVLAALENEPENVSLLLEKARLTQLVEYPGLELADAKAALAKASELQPHHPDVLADLAFFLYAIEDDAKQAIPLFVAADGIYTARFLKLLHAQADYYRALARREDAEWVSKQISALQRCCVDLDAAPSLKSFNAASTASASPAPESDEVDRLLEKIERIRESGLEGAERNSLVRETLDLLQEIQRIYQGPLEELLRGLEDCLRELGYEQEAELAYAKHRAVTGFPLESQPPKTSE